MADIKANLAQRQPYQQWLDEHMMQITGQKEEGQEPEELEEHGEGGSGEKLFARQQLFGYTHEDIEMVLRPILSEMKDPVWSMEMMRRWLCSRPRCAHLPITSPALRPGDQSAHTIHYASGL